MVFILLWKIFCSCVQCQFLDEGSQYKTEKRRQYNCAHCKFQALRERMAVHLAVHHGKRRPFSCKECGLRYGYLDSFRDHYIGVHTSSQFTCTECGKVSTFHDSFTVHVVSIFLLEL